MRCRYASTGIQLFQCTITKSSLRRDRDRVFVPLVLNEKMIGFPPRVTDDLGLLTMSELIDSLVLVPSIHLERKVIDLTATQFYRYIPLLDTCRNYSSLFNVLSNSQGVRK